MKKIIASICLGLFAISALAQNINVKGTVLDASGLGVIGAGVIVDGTTIGAVVDFDGNFEIPNVPEGSTLTASCIGYTSVTLSAAPVLNFVLEEDSMMLAETVVVGYGSMKKSNVSGAVSSVKADDLPKAASASVGSMLRGRAAGMNITNNNAAPGGSLNISIRGGLSGMAPLIIVDGVPQAGNAGVSSSSRYSGSSKDGGLININPNDIESIDILKDASAAAIYGSDASGGVILITTKRGKSGKADISYSGSVAASVIKDAPKFMGARDYMQEMNRVFDELGRGDEKKYTQSQIDAFVGDGTDWMSEVTRVGIIHEHNLSVTAGNDNTRILASGSYYDHQGIAKNNDMKRITGRLNADHKFSDKVKAGVNTQFSQIAYNDVPLGDGRQDNAALIYSAMTFNPTVPVRDLDGRYSTNPIRDIYPNPVSLLEITDQTRTRNLVINGFLEYRPITGLLLKATAGIDMKDTQWDQYIPTTTKAGYSVNGEGSKVNSKSQLALLNIIGQYDKTFADIHELSIMGGWEYKKSKWESMSIHATGFPFDDQLYNNLATSLRGNRDVGSMKGSMEMASFLGRLNYTLMDRYILTANFRVDGSSNFSKSHQWGFFPGVSLAWKMKEESWLKDVRWLTTLKLRAGVGQTGNAGSLTGINTYYTVMKSPSFAPGGQPVNGVGYAQLGNPDLKWETLTDYTVGIDFGFLNNRINGTIDFYQRMRTDIILQKALMSYSEVSTMDYNSGQVEMARGFDFGVHSVNMDTGKFYWTTDLNLSVYRNYIVKRDKDWIPNIYEPTVMDMGDIYGYRTDGLIQSGEYYDHLPNSGAGAIKYLDINGYYVDDMGNRLTDREGRYIHSGQADGALDMADYVKLFNATPVPFSINNTFNWGNWDANIYIYGSLNGWKINDVKYQSVYGLEDITYGVNALEEVKNRWTATNTSATLPGVNEAKAGIGPEKSDFFYEKSWYLRLDNVSIGYSFPSAWFKDKIRTFRAYVSARNLFVITPYTGMDPETGNGIGAYPNYMSFAFGLDLKF